MNILLGRIFSIRFTFIRAARWRRRWRQRGFDHRNKNTAGVLATDRVQTAGNQTLINTLRRRQVSSDGGGIGGEGGGASVERIAASRINITARRSVLPSCLIPLLLLSLPAFCFSCLPTLQLLGLASPFLSSYFFFFAPSRCGGPKQPKWNKKYKNNNNNEKK